MHLGDPKYPIILADPYKNYIGELTGYKKADFYLNSVKKGAYSCTPLGTINGGK